MIANGTRMKQATDKTIQRINDANRFARKRENDTTIRQANGFCRKHMQTVQTGKHVCFAVANTVARKRENEFTIKHTQH